jgi:Chemotaxis protein histidine kinase and related kinases
VNKFFRAIHTIKGNSGLFELENIKNLSHNFENLLSKVRDSEIPLKRDLVDVSLLAIDRIREMIQNIDKIQDYNIKDLVENINKLLNVDNQSEQNHTKKNNHNNIDLESLYNKFIKKYQDKIKQYKEKLPIQHKLFYVLSFLEKNQLLSEFVNNIDQIKENNDISLINFNFILPSFNDRLYFYLFLSTEEDFSLPFPILLKKQIVLEEEPREEVLTIQKENIKSSTNIAILTKKNHS